MFTPVAYLANAGAHIFGKKRPSSLAMWPLFTVLSDLLRGWSSAACSGQQATPEFFRHLGAPGRLFLRQDSHSSAIPSLEGGLLVRWGVAAVASRSILPHGLLSVFESAIYLSLPASSATCSGLQATPESRLLSAPGHKCARSLASSARPPCGAAFLSLRRGGCSQPSHSPSRAP